MEAGLQRSMASYVMMRFGRTASARHTVGWMGCAGGRLDLEEHKHIPGYQLNIVHDRFAPILRCPLVHIYIYIGIYIRITKVTSE